MGARFYISSRLVSYGTKSIRNIPPLGCAGLHASLLPKYRGGAPLVWAIINGEKETGISLFYLAEGVDDGNIISQKKVSVTLRDTIKTVYERIERATLSMLEETIPLIKERRVIPTKNEIEKGSLYPQRKPEDGLIDWNKPCLEIYNFIRAQTHPYPGAFTYHEKKKLIIWRAKIFDFVDKSGAPGEVIKVIDTDWAKGFMVATQRDDIPLLVEKVAVEETKHMEALQYAKEKNFSMGGHKR